MGSQSFLETAAQSHSIGTSNCVSPTALIPRSESFRNGLSASLARIRSTFSVHWETDKGSPLVGGPQNRNRVHGGRLENVPVGPEAQEFDRGKGRLVRETEAVA